MCWRGAGLWSRRGWSVSLRTVLRRKVRWTVGHEPPVRGIVERCWHGKQILADFFVGCGCGYGFGAGIYVSRFGKE